MNPLIPPKYGLGFYPSTVTSVTNSNIYSLPGVHFALFQQSRKSHHSPKISILLRCPARLKPEKFSKSKSEPGPKIPRPIDIYWLVVGAMGFGVGFAGFMLQTIFHISVEL